MNNFKDFNIKPSANFTGNKIDIDDILNTVITVHKYKISPSTKKPGTQFLTLQIEKDGIQRVIFTGSKNLTNIIEQVPKDKFPFKTTIVRQAKLLEFT